MSETVSCITRGFTVDIARVVVTLRVVAGTEAVFDILAVGADLRWMVDDPVSASTFFAEAVLEGAGCREIDCPSEVIVLAGLAVAFALATLVGRAGAHGIT